MGKLSSLTLGSGVTSIGENAFGVCSSLTSLTIGSGVTTIGKDAFNNCTALETLTLGSKVETIGDNAFYKCSSLTSLEIPASVTTIGESAFVFTGLTTLEIPVTVTTVGSGAFGSCTALTSATIPNNSGIASNIFNGCSSLTTLTINGTGTIEDTNPAKGSLSNVLTTLIIGNGITGIGENAFEYMGKLSSLTLGSGVTSIGKNAFGVCPSLAAITVAEGNSKYDSREGCNAIIETLTDKLVTGCKNSVLTDDIKAIGDNAFEGCSDLASITIPTSVTSIGDFAFADCSNLAVVNVLRTASVPTLGSQVFDGNKDGRKIYVFGSSVNAYKDDWTAYSSDITSIPVLTLGTGVTATGSEVFTDGDATCALLDATVTLGYSDAPAGYTTPLLAYIVDGTAIEGNIFTMPANDVAVNAKWTIDATHFEQTGTDEYTIHTAPGWDVFCDMLTDGESFSDKTVRLDNDITVTRMAGGNDKPFSGTFDGQGNTLTLNYGTSDNPVDAQFIAPFVFTIWNTTPVFRNLTIDGYIYDGYTGTEAHNVAGLIGHLYGNVTIEHCTSNVNITATGGAGGFVGLCEHTVSFSDCLSSTVVHSEGGNNSGFVAWSRASGHNINFTGCLFNGKLLQRNDNGSSNGGFIGWTGTNKTVTITDCLYAPATLADSETMASNNSATFARGWNNTTTATNSYYTTAFGTAQGKAPLTVTAGDNVTVEAVSPVGDATATYTVSGITAYTKGITHTVGEATTFYYGQGDDVSLTLSHGDRTGYTFDDYEVSSGTLSGTTLTMPNAEVTINAQWTENVLELADNADNTTAIAYAAATDKIYNRVILNGRTLWKDGAWNTLCLPFDMSEAQVMEQLSPDALMTLKETAFRGGTLTLDFENTTTIEAGKPYIIKWVGDGTANLMNPVFTGVTISTVTANVETDYVDFVGTYSPVDIFTAEKTNLYFSSNNTIYYPWAEGMTSFNLNACRAYFQLKNGLTAGDKTTDARAFVLNIGGKEEATGITTTRYIKDPLTQGSDFTNSDAWYTLDGRKLSGTPTKSGVYVNNGKKIVIK